MSRLDWEKERARSLRRIGRQQARESTRPSSRRTQAHADYLASVIESVKAAKRRGEYISLPADLGRKDQKLVWARALTELKEVAR